MSNSNVTDDEWEDVPTEKIHSPEEKKVAECMDQVRCSSSAVQKRADPASLPTSIPAPTAPSAVPTPSAAPSPAPLQTVPVDKTGALPGASSSAEAKRVDSPSQPGPAEQAPLPPRPVSSAACTRCDSREKWLDISANSIKTLNGRVKNLEEELKRWKVMYAELQVAKLTTNRVPSERHDDPVEHVDKYVAREAADPMNKHQVFEDRWYGKVQTEDRWLTKYLDRFLSCERSCCRSNGQELTLYYDRYGRPVTFAWK